jgi:hypothetical protein
MHSLYVIFNMEKEMIERDKLELQWIQRISKLLVGKKIVKVEYMNEADAEEQGWYKRPIQIRLEDGTWLTPSQDDEGNDGGALFTSNEDLPTIPVI